MKSRGCGIPSLARKVPSRAGATTPRDTDLHGTTSSSRHGFTLIELVVVVIVVGLLAVIALPSYLNVAGSAKESEAAPILAEIYTLQQTYRMIDAKYASSLGSLKPGFDGETAAKYYTFSLTATDDEFTACAIPRGPFGIRHFGMNQHKQLKSQWYECPS